MPAPPQGDRKLQIRKYPNRRYYDSTRSRHVTLEEIHALIRDGYNIQVTDSRTGLDITGKVLAQIIIDLDPQKLDIFPALLLHKLLRSSEQLVTDFVQKYFNQALDSFLDSQRNVEQAMRSAMGLPTGAPTIADMTKMMWSPLTNAPWVSPESQHAPAAAARGAAAWRKGPAPRNSASAGRNRAASGRKKNRASHAVARDNALAIKILCICTTFLLTRTPPASTLNSGISYCRCRSHLFLGGFLMSNNAAEATVAGNREISGLFDQAFRTFGDSLEVAMKAQEDIVKFWGDAAGKTHPLQAFTDDVIPTAQQNADQYLRLMESTYRRNADLAKKVIHCQNGDHVGLDKCAHDLWETSMEVARENVQDAAGTNLCVAQSWAEVFKKGTQKVAVGK